MRGQKIHVRNARWTLIILLAVTQPVWSAKDHAAAVDPVIDIQSYELRVDYDLSHTRFDIAGNSLSGKAQIVYRNGSSAPIDHVPIVLNRLLRLKAATDADHHSLVFDQHLTELSNLQTLQVRAADIHLQVPLAHDKTTTLTLIYEGGLIGYQETGMEYVRERLDPDFTIIRPENLAYPIIAEPTREAVQARWGNDMDVFDQHIIVTVPKGEYVVFNGTLTEQRGKENTTTFDYMSNRPSGFIVATVAPYAELERDKNRVFFFEKDRRNAEQFADAMVRGVHVLESWFGPMPSSAQGVEVVEIPENYGSQTIPPMIIQTADAFGEFNPLYHELSHLWDIRGTDPSPPRWEEGLAMFASALVEEKADNKTTARLDMEKRLFKIAKGMLKQDASARTLPMASYGQQHKTDFSYSVGGVFIALLYQSLGEEKFIAFIGTFRHAHPDGASFAEFASAIRALGSVQNQLADDFLIGTAGIDRLMAAGTWEELQAHYGELNRR